MPAKPPRSKKFARLSHEIRRDLAEELREIIVEAKNRPCADCGNLYARTFGDQMTFDHLDPNAKRFNIGAVGVSNAGTFGHNLVTKKELLQEIAKCEVVCWSCHKKREKLRAWERFGAIVHAAYLLGTESLRRRRAEASQKTERDRQAFDHVGRIFVLAYERALKRRFAYEQSQTWEALWRSAIGNVAIVAGAAFWFGVLAPRRARLERLSEGKKKEKDEWRKNYTPRPWKGDGR